MNKYFVTAASILGSLVIGYGSASAASTPGNDMVQKNVNNVAAKEGTAKACSTKIKIHIPIYSGSGWFCLFGGAICTISVDIEIEVGIVSIGGNPLPPGAKGGVITHIDGSPVTPTTMAVPIGAHTFGPSQFTSMPAIPYGISFPTQSGAYDASFGGYLFYYY